MNISNDLQYSILKILAAILHLGNIEFQEVGAYSQVKDKSYLDFPAYLLGITAEALEEKLTTRLMESKWGGKTDVTTMTLTLEQVLFFSARHGRKKKTEIDKIRDSFTPDFSFS